MTQPFIYFSAHSEYCVFPHIELKNSMTKAYWILWDISINILLKSESGYKCLIFSSFFSSFAHYFGFGRCKLSFSREPLAQGVCCSYFDKYSLYRKKVFHTKFILHLFYVRICLTILFFTEMYFSLDKYGPKWNYSSITYLVQTSPTPNLI